MTLADVIFVLQSPPYTTGTEGKMKEVHFERSQTYIRDTLTIITFKCELKEFKLTYQ